MTGALNLDQYVTITQRTGKQIKARHAGEDYVFESGVPQIVKYETACHVFGLDCEDKTQALARLGWVRTSDEIEAALEKLKQVSFSEVSLETSASDARPFVNAGELSEVPALPAPSDGSLDTEAGAADL
jgi:hypothetical protein